jgi:hypothetical protein
VLVFVPTSIGIPPSGVPLAIAAGPCVEREPLEQAASVAITSHTALRKATPIVRTIEI